MSKQKDTYFSGTEYENYYFAEISPSHIRFKLLINGFDLPQQWAMQHHCELGFGQGLSLNIHAATNSGTWYGTDYSAEQAQYAQQLAVISQSEVHIYSDSFESFLQRDLPQLDSITLHGIFSWISTENQQLILQFIEKNLKPGGFVYVSYNAAPGRVIDYILQDLLSSYYDSHPHETVENNVTNALRYAQEVLSLSEDVLKHHPHLIEELAYFSKKNKNYVAHEFFHHQWQCISFNQMQWLMKPHQLSYALQVDISDRIRTVSLNEQQQQYLATLPNDILREQCLDMFESRNFRRDIYVKGIRKISLAQTFEKIKDLSILLFKPLENIQLSNVMHQGRKLTLSEEIYQPILRFLASNQYQAKRIEDIYEALPKIEKDAFLERLDILFTLGYIMPYHPLAKDEPLIQQGQSINQYLLDNRMDIVCSPNVGCAFSVGFDVVTSYYVQHTANKANLTDGELVVLLQQYWDKRQLSVLDEQGKAITDQGILAEKCTTPIAKMKKYKPILDQLNLFR